MLLDDEGQRPRLRRRCVRRRLGGARKIPLGAIFVERRGSGP